MAGLWESWKDRTSGEVIESFTIITTDANALAAPIHDRMPVIIDPNDFDTWLSTPSPPEHLLRPYPAEAMESYPVSTWVNSPAHDDPRCIERVEAI
jgi:putative SOS response-associated peptidase YedK